MKFYQIALFIFVFNASISVLNSANIFGAYIVHDTQWMQDLNTKFDTNNTYSVNPAAVFGDFIKGLKIILEAIGNATILLPFFLTQLGVPAELKVVLTAGTWLTYAIAIGQFLAGRTVER